MFLFILDSLGNGELLVILVAALIFFGPRKLPQLSRSVGKSLSEFRRASDDFKRTWAQEVSLEDVDRRTIASPSIAAVDASIMGNTVQRNVATPVIAEDAPEVGAPLEEVSLETSQEKIQPEPGSEPLRKQDWL